MAKLPKLSTIRSNISHLRKMLSRLDKTHLVIPSKDYRAPTRIYQSGSRLRIDGKVYTPADLDALAGKKVEWHVDVVRALETKLMEQEYAMIKLTGSRKSKKTNKEYKTTKVTEREKAYAEAGRELIQDIAVEALKDWMDSNSDGWKKNLFYHEHGFLAVDRGTTMEFFDFYGITFSGDYQDIYDDLVEKLGE